MGFDAHKLVVGKRLVLGGVHVPFHRGLEGDSDGDAATHALADALLGAAALGDLGTYFRIGDPAFPPGVSSLLILKRTVELVRQSGWKVENVDATIVAQLPRLAAHVLGMREALAETLGLSIDRVSVKSTTTDGMGFTGSSEGIAAYAVASLSEASTASDGTT